MNVYIVEALRWGSRENHSYVLGAFDNMDSAIELADAHVWDRGGKYYLAVYQTAVAQKADNLDRSEVNCVYVAWGIRNKENERWEFDD